jgi:hypothetical protein
MHSLANVVVKADAIIWQPGERATRRKAIMDVFFKLGGT